MPAVLVETIKRCSRCSTDRPCSEFSLLSAGFCGRHSLCKPCVREYSRQWSKNRLRKPRSAFMRRAQKYSLRHETLREMLRQSQCEACGIELKIDSEKKVDHRHCDGAVRGILCDRCNRTLGLCQEDPKVLLGICEYISKTQGVDYRKQPYLEQESVFPASNY